MSDVVDSIGDENPSAQLLVLPLVAAVELLDGNVRKALQLLAVSVALSAEELASVWSDSLRDEEPLDSAALEVVQGLPLVETLGGRMRVMAPLGVELARQIAASDALTFDSVHRSLVGIEREREEALEREDPGGSDLWQTKALVAYYLLRNSPDIASSQLIESFDDVPINDRRTCRLWLADLSDRYSGISGEETRVGRFFQAFRYYVSGLRELAELDFRSLIEEEGSDRIAAISQHLLAVGLSWNDTERRGLLRASVSLSARLGLTENLVMSRNTLVFQLLRESRQGGPHVGVSLDEALEAAGANDALADTIGSPVYQTATRYSRAVSLLEHADRARHALPQFDESISTLLGDAESFAVAAHDLAAWLRARLVRVDLMVRLDRPSEALESLQVAVETVERSEALPELPRRQFDRQLENVQAQFIPHSVEADETDELGRRFRRALRRDD